MLRHGHYCCHIKDGLSKISWNLQSFELNNLQQLKDVLLSGDGLYYAMQRGHRQSVYTFFNQLKNFCDTDQLLTSKPMDLEVIKALEEILRARDSIDKMPSFFIAWQNGHIQIVEAFFTFIHDLIDRYSALKDCCLKILFYIHDQYSSSLNLSLSAKKANANVVHKLLTWPERLDLKIGNSQVKAWFETININQQSVFQLADRHTDARACPQSENHL